MDRDVQDRHELRRMGNVRFWPKAAIEKRSTRAT